MLFHTEEAAVDSGEGKGEDKPLEASKGAYRNYSAFDSY